MYIKKYKFVILGAGVSGLTTAYELSAFFPGEVAIIEKESVVGGLCKTIERNGSLYDLGSHRLHKDMKQDIFEFIEKICNGSIIKNMRKSKLRIKKSYIDYPITSVKMIYGLGFVESFLCIISLLATKIKLKIKMNRKNVEKGNYESYIVSKAGRRAYKLFYEPYAKKVWGLEPSLISTAAVKKRISMSKPTELFKNIIFNIFKMKKQPNFYYYINGGIGKFSLELESRISSKGCGIFKNAIDLSIEITADKKIVTFLNHGEKISIEFEKLISTIPIDDLVVMLDKNGRLRSLLDELRWTGLRIVYLHVSGEPQIDGETFYFPELAYCFGRVSVPKKFYDQMQREHFYTSLACEIPCSENSDIWKMNDNEICNLCYEDLVKAKLINRKQKIVEGMDFVISINKVYPLFVLNWEKTLTNILEYLGNNFPFVYSSGKLGLFMHSNLDHSIEIGQKLARCLVDNNKSKEWYQSFSYFQSMKLRD